MGTALRGLGQAFVRLRPDLVLLLGDRYEIFCAAAAAASLGIPLGHFHGGEMTRGAMDDAFRHAITKMSHVHFTATRRARQKVIQMGEAPTNVHWVGAPGLDGIERRGRLSRRQLERILGVPLRRRNLLVTYHPVTLEKGRASAQIRNLCAVLRGFPAALIVFTGVHPDPEGGLIQREISRFVKTHPHALSVSSLGGEAYLSLMRHVDAVVGNSSSGLIEAPSVGCWALNIGARQEGREGAGNVLHVKCQRRAIEEGLLRILRRSGRRPKKRFRNPYARKGTHLRVVRILERVPFNKILKKTFFEGKKSHD
jgi:GDP/UDP-N,N'-diacetylbacillosamine 2-epimerase (hydrolysing)